MTTNKGPGGGGGSSGKVDFADVPAISAGCTSRCGCNVLQRIEETGGRPIPDIEQLALDGRTGKGLRSWPWSGTIQIDPNAEQITVTTNVLAVNRTGKNLMERTAILSRSQTMNSVAEPTASRQP
ncbi:MAG: hypothetical protein Q4G26_07485 [Paracoccus sp. (in: a-proteobacteria)]|nr:hypothetical protein [Paracoccus sp. (in: a-proteobacteria)]